MGKYKFEYKYRRELKQLYIKYPFLKTPFDKLFDFKNKVAPHYKLPLLIGMLFLVYQSYLYLIRLDFFQRIKTNADIQKFVWYALFLLFIPICLKTFLNVGRSLLTNSRTGSLKNVEKK
jgi:hypothetical protein